VETALAVEHDELVDSGQAELGVRSALYFDGRYWLEFRGSLDEAALYRRALTPCEVSDHHRAGAPPAPGSSTAVITVCGSVDGL
jgi:hypothetical protein